MSVLAARLLPLLPAGLWTGVEVISAPDGFMANKGIALLARAQYLGSRPGPAFIKWLVQADPGSGTSAIVLTSIDRLDALRARIAQIEESGLPTVRVLRLERFAEPQSLLIAMEEVDTIQSCIATGGASISLAVQVLRSLDPVLQKGAMSEDWVHFDICPQNTALTRDGRVVFIDLESLYFSSNEHIAVSTAMCKIQRLPTRLVTALHQEMTLAGGTTFSVPFMQRKHKVEVLVVAAECVLGVLPPGRFDDVVQDWVSRASCSEAMRAFWRRELAQLCANGDVGALQAIAERLENAEKAGASPRDGAVELPPLRSAQDRALAPVEEESAVRIRLGQMSDGEVALYFDALLQKASAHPEQVDLWNELIFVAVSHMKDPVKALEVARLAATHHRDDKNLKTTTQILEMWSIR